MFFLFVFLDLSDLSNTGFSAQHSTAAFYDVSGLVLSWDTITDNERGDFDGQYYMCPVSGVVFTLFRSTLYK